MEGGSENEKSMRLWKRRDCSMTTKILNQFDPDGSDKVDSQSMVSRLQQNHLAKFA
jgi:hypothetical protein